MPAGRPTKYSEELVAKLCANLAKGRSLAKICKESWAPTVETVFQWIHSKPEFSERYARAKEESADYLADEIVEIADQDPGELFTGGKDSAAVNHQRLRVDARKWVAAKLKPKKYGERIQQEIELKGLDQLAKNMANARKRARSGNK